LSLTCLHPTLCYGKCADCGEAITITFKDGKRYHNGVLHEEQPEAMPDMFRIGWDAGYYYYQSQPTAQEAWDNYLLSKRVKK
jgi:hypothetical protein